MFLLLAGGCVRTTHPILKDDQVMADDAMLGKWVASNGKSQIELKPAADHRYKLCYVNEDGKKGNFLLRFGKIGEVTVAELSADAFGSDINEEYKSLLIPLYSLVVIEKDAPTPVLNAISVDWLDKYTKANPDELDVMKIGDQDDIINSSTEDFQAFFTRHIKDNGMLGKSQAYVHPGDPTTQPAK